MVKPRMNERTFPVTTYVGFVQVGSLYLILRKIHTSIFHALIRQLGFLCLPRMYAVPVKRRTLVSTFPHGSDIGLQTNRYYLRILFPIV
jgi:hypothetical protein